MDLLCSVLWNIDLIPISPKAEPPDFNRRVRQPGTAFLLRTGNPTSNAWRGHDYWRKALHDLLLAYRMVCSYSGCWTKARSGSASTIQDSSVDHYIPKSLSPAQAYEWDNFRLSRARLNNSKGNHRDVIDPFSLSGRYFTIDFTSFLVRPNGTLSSSNKTKVQKTIDRLKLNLDNDYVQERIGVVRGYCLGQLPATTVARYWPFIANEMRVQDFDNKLLPVMRRVFQTR